MREKTYKQLKKELLKDKKIKQAYEGLGSEFAMIEILKKFLQKEKGILFCYLFGSQATKSVIPESDVDLGVYLDKNRVKDFFEKRLELIGEISKTIKKEVDIVVLNTASPFLRYVILREGRLIFERDESERIDFELKSLNEYFDFKPILEKYHQRLLTP